MSETLKAILYIITGALIGAISSYAIPALFKFLGRKREKTKMVEIIKSETAVNLAYSVAIQDDLLQMGDQRIRTPSDPTHMITCPILNAIIENPPVCLNTSDMQLLVLLKEAYNSLVNAMTNYQNGVVKPRLQRWDLGIIGILHPDRRAFGNSLSEACDKFYRTSHYVFAELNSPFDDNDPIEGPWQ